MLVRFTLAVLLVLVVASLLLHLATPPPSVRAASPSQTVVIGVGDILLGRRLGAEMARTGDYALAFRHVREILAGADITFGNLEGPFCANPPYPASGTVFRFRPRAVESLQRAGFDVVSVANNHIGDGGDACIRFSLAHLRDAGIAPVGAGHTFEEAHEAAILERNGTRFAFLAYTYAARGDTPQSRRPVVAGRDRERVRLDVARARTRADVVIVSLHDGVEYTSRVTPETESFARAAIDAGARIVFGHHPHVPQRVEAYRDGWIFYSLGNFVFQQNTPPATRTALLARLVFSGSALARVEAVPVVIEWFAQPRLAGEGEGIPILQAVGLAGPILWDASGAAASGTEAPR